MDLKTSIFLIFSIIQFVDLRVVRSPRSTDDLGLDFDPCEENNLNECFRSILQTSFIDKSNGSKSLNFPSIEPLEVPRQKFNYTGPSGVDIMIILENVKVHGSSNTTIESVKTSVNEQGLRAVVTAFTPRFEVYGDYKANVKVNILKLRPKGNFSIILTDVRNIQKVENVFETQNGKKYLKIKKLSMEPTIGDIKFNATGIFPDKALNDFSIEVINQYLSEFYQVIINESQYVWEPLILATANEILQKIPYDRLVNGSKKLN